MEGMQQVVFKNVGFIFDKYYLYFLVISLYQISLSKK